MESGGISMQRLKIGKLTKKYLFFDMKLNKKDQWQEANMTIIKEG